MATLAGDLETELPVAVWTMLAGGFWAPRQLVNQYLQQMKWIRSNEFRSSFALTFRENQVLQMILRRFSNREVAGALVISERTVKFHVSNIFAKLHVNKRIDLFSALVSARAESPG